MVRAEARARKAVIKTQTLYDFFFFSLHHRAVIMGDSRDLVQFHSIFLSIFIPALALSSCLLFFPPHFRAVRLEILN